MYPNNLLIIDAFMRKTFEFLLLLLIMYGILVLGFTLEPVWISNLIKYVENPTFDEI